MKRVLRWPTAVVVTVTAFAAATWICGAFVLTMRDTGVRWGIAGSLGVAVAAIAALWGHAYATRGDHKPTPEQTSSAPAGIGATRNTISGGTFHGTVIQSRHVETVNFAEPGTPAPPATADGPSAEGKIA
jgi:hypothetical protein